ncbi:unnamed protein product [Somion occarium]|uniref:GDP/GTP exchange factor Sec2 N-terminal domain-containing protein n=1 Tax=Somion occarium TaxID=3059160 RepID=A0ABP1CUV4_9APHY
MGETVHHEDEEMHELNQEADFLEQKVAVDPNGTTDNASKVNRHHSDPDAQAMVIDSLRSQVQDLFAQVSQLNSKLVRSYDRVSDLEDEIHVTSSNLRQATLKISQLELERTQHLSALSTGLLVEKSHVTSELTRLMEKATEEAARRGQAESARAEIEQELDDLSAGLFDQANRMVAEARFARARSEQKVTETETALKSAEEVVGILQSQMQRLEAEKEQAQRRVEEMRATMGKGKWVSRPRFTGTMKLHLLCTHLPYHEYLQFIGHLRSIRPTTQHAPAMSTLLPLPLLARLVSEDSDPTVRLDMAPSLNWLTRRSVLSAIHSGQLTVEPMSTSTLLEELSPPNIPGSIHHTHVACALCGATILDPPSSGKSTHLLSPNRNASWTSASALLKNSLQSISPASNTNFSTLALHNAPPSEPPTQVYIFRLATSSSGLPVSLPIASQQSNAQQRPTIYPLCTTGWCLTRLRTTCCLWAFIRTGIVEKVWEEEPFVPTPSSETPKSNVNGVSKQPESGSPSSDSKAPVPPPRRSRIGALWGTMQRGLSGSREPGTESPVKSEEGERRTASPAPPSTPTKRRLPPPPPSHPSVHAPVPRLAQPQPQAQSAPPPLPKRNRTRDEHHQPVSRSESPALPNRTASPAVNGVSTNADSTSVHTESTQTASQEAPRLTLPEAPESVRSESHDHFITPVEEYPPSTPSRPISPATIPLPASGPSTPVPTETELPPELPSAEATSTTSEETPPPAPASVPAAAASAVPSAAEDTAPAQTVRPVPPPLPRRAAARTRPTSTATPAAVSVPTTEPAPTESKEVATQNSAPSSEVHGTVDEEDVSKNEVLPASEERHESTDRSTSPQEGTGSVELTPGIRTPSPTQSPPLDVSNHDDQNSNSSAEKVSTSPVVISDIDLFEEKERDAEVHRDGVDVPEETAEEDEIPGVYVTDGTWEERTWKELVKLREDMFWARLGGHR